MDPNHAYDLTLTTLCTAIVIIIHHYLFAPDRLQAFVKTRPTVDGQARAVYAHRLSGIIWLGLIPLAIATLARRADTSLGLGLDRPNILLWSVPMIALVVLPSIWFNSRRAHFRQNYPQIRGSTWSPSRHLMNALTWVLYLVAYEYLFRGFLLFGLADAVGLWPAISIMTMAYTFAHIDRPPAEAFGCVPIGFVFGYLALESGGIWGPVIIHAMIAISNDEFCLHRSRRAMVEDPINDTKANGTT